MNISSVIIENVKGIKHLEITKDLLPNRPNILVATNGFGKSSIAAAFNSLKSNKLELIKENLHEENDTLQPLIKLQLTNGEELIANSATNTISQKFSVFVISNPIKPIAKAQRFGATVTAKASLEIPDVVVVKTIPKKVNFVYSIKKLREKLGSNGKVLNDISELFNRIEVVKKIDKQIDFHKFELKKFKSAIGSILDHAKALDNNTAENLKTQIIQSGILDIECPEFSKLISIIDTELKCNNKCDSVLSAWQYIETKAQMSGAFKKAIEYLDYKIKREILDKTLESINPFNTRFKLKSSEHKGSLIVKWPKSHLISSGQRDILVFISKLIECEYQSKDNCILIIDEFFDYLDDANVVAFQYYISTLINSFRENKRIIFPILLTHLDPNYLKHFCFNETRLNVCYLQEVNSKVGKEMMKIISNRENKLIKNELDEYYFHYNPNLGISLEDKFNLLNLNKAWANPQAFRKKIDRDLRRYLLEPDLIFDPISVCLSIRLRIEEIVYNQLQTDNDKLTFLSTHKTTKKLQYAQSKGVSFSETFYLLGIIYNHPLHTNEQEDLSKQLGIKLINSTIKAMIYNLWQ